MSPPPPLPPQEQNLLPRRRSQLLDLPDFLHNSPFLPVVAPPPPFKPAQARPTLQQILRSKPAQTIAVLALAVTTLLILQATVHRTDILSPLLGPKCINLPATEPPLQWDDSRTDWSKFAYAQYVTNVDSLCNSLMIFDALRSHGTKAAKMMMYPRGWSEGGMRDGAVETRLLATARARYGVDLVPVDVQRVNAQYRMWADSYTKLLAFNQTAYTRLILVDSDSTLARPMDELFFLPPAPVALPRAYWLDTPQLTSHIMVITPSSSSFARIRHAIAHTRPGEFDMEIVNQLFGRTCLRIPHEKYALLTGEYRKDHHEAYLGGKQWDPKIVGDEAKLVHFSDHPLPKPWDGVTMEDLAEMRPKCRVTEDGREDCTAEAIWTGFYLDFKKRRKLICRM